MLPYPKVGTPNPSIKILIKDLSDDSSEALEVAPPSTFLDNVSEYIYFRAYWITKEKFGVIWMNRVQNYSSTSECTLGARASTWTCESVLDFGTSPGWLLIQKPLYGAENRTFLQILPKKESDGLSYQHVAKVSDGRIGLELSNVLHSTPK